MSQRIIGKKMKNIIKESTIIIMFIVLIILFTAINNNFLSAENITNIVRQSSVMIVLACGSTFVMIAANIDISVGAVACLTSIIACLLMRSGMNMILAIFIAVCFGAVCGVINGTIVAQFKIPPMVVTLGMMNLTQGLSYLLTGGTAVYDLPSEFNFIGRGTLGLLPFQVVVMAFVMLICHVLLSKTTFGRHIYAIGGNVRVASLVGINVKMDVVITYIIAGICATLSGIMMASRMGSGQPTMGTSWSMDNITAIVIGGTSISGGQGSMIKSLMGVLLLTMITNGLNIIGMNTYYQLVATAIILLVTVIFNSRKK